MNKAKEKHSVRIILRNWNKTKKGNAPVAEIHSKTRKEVKKS